MFFAFMLLTILLFISHNVTAQHDTTVVPPSASVVLNGWKCRVINA